MFWRLAVTLAVMIVMSSPQPKRSAQADVPVIALQALRTAIFDALDQVRMDLRVHQEARR
jgi:hypothetical protein